MKSWIVSLGMVGIVAALGCTQQVGDDGKSAAPVSAADKAMPKMTPVAMDAKFDRWIPSPTRTARERGTLSTMRFVRGNLAGQGANASSGRPHDGSDSWGRPLAGSWGRASG